ncbi:unnamed protein product [Urochloa humidicola]
MTDGQFVSIHTQEQSRAEQRSARGCSTYDDEDPVACVQAGSSGRQTQPLPACRSSPSSSRSSDRFLIRKKKEAEKERLVIEICPTSPLMPADGSVFPVAPFLICYYVLNPFHLAVLLLAVCPNCIED